MLSVQEALHSLIGHCRQKPTLAGIWAARVSIAYVGIMSAGVGYTLQLIGQRRTRPEAASLIMSLESVFAALAGWVILHEVMTAREIFGCVLLFAAIILVQKSESAS
mgnify:CR=1 FL=1